MKRLICTLLVVWLALLSVGTHAHATADAAHTLGHLSLPEPGAADEADEHSHASTQAAAGSGHSQDHHHDHDHDHADACGPSHCGQGYNTGLPTSLHAHLVDAGNTAPLATLQSWNSSQQTNNIERPKWPVTTPAVVNFLS